MATATTLSTLDRVNAFFFAILQTEAKERIYSPKIHQQIYNTSIRITEAGCQRGINAYKR